MSLTRPDSTAQPTAGPAPADEVHPGAEGWGIGLRVWIERAGQSILGPGRLELLETIDRLHSISAAARQLRMSYRHAWELVQGINESAGEPLITTATGGVRGGGAQLTSLGRWAIAAFRQVQASLRQSAAGLTARLGEDAAPATLHVAAAMSLEEVVGQLLTDFSLQSPRVRVRAIYGASDELADHLLAGAPGDLFLTADPHQLDRLQAADLFQRERQVALAENGLAAIGAADGAIAVRRPADLAAGAWRIALADPNCPLGGYTRAYLEERELYADLRPRAVWVENSRAALAAVRAGQADLALVYSSDAACASGCRALFTVRRLSVPIRYCGAVLGRGSASGPAERLLAFLTSPAAAQRFRRCGFLPNRPVTPAADG